MATGLTSMKDMCRIQKQTIPDPYYVSMFHQDMIADMYSSRVVGISCIALQRVGYGRTDPAQLDESNQDDLVPATRGEDGVSPFQPDLEPDELADDMSV